MCMSLVEERAEMTSKCGLTRRVVEVAVLVAIFALESCWLLACWALRSPTYQCHYHRTEFLIDRVETARLLTIVCQHRSKIVLSAIACEAFYSPWNPDSERAMMSSPAPTLR